MTTLLPNIHVSPETAYVVEDYPYGFRMRCKIRYWLEFHKTHGVRLMSQTTNPKRGNTWNKPKASTYCRFAGAMFLDDDGHVQWSGMHEYMDGTEAVAWRDTYGTACHPAAMELMHRWVNAKIAYDASKGERMADKAKDAYTAFVQPISNGK